MRRGACGEWSSSQLMVSPLREALRREMQAQRPEKLAVQSAWITNGWRHTTIFGAASARLGKTDEAVECLYSRPPN